jgi:aspartate ammonia-lyase
MPGKVNPVIPEFVISSAHRIYSNDQLIASLSAQGCLELNAYLPEIGCAMLDSLKLMIAMNQAIHDQLLIGLQVREELARNRLFRSPAVTTALSPLIGYNRATKLARRMKESGRDVFQVNAELNVIDPEQLEKVMEPHYLLKKGFTMQDIREVKE